MINILVTGLKEQKSFIGLTDSDYTNIKSQSNNGKNNYFFTFKIEVSFCHLVNY